MDICRIRSGRLTLLFFFVLLPYGTSEGVPASPSPGVMAGEDNATADSQPSPTLTPATLSRVDFSQFRVCSASVVGDLFRFPLEHTCPETLDAEHEEGILVVLKANIIPYIFKVRKYRKAVTVLTVWAGFYSSSITARDDSSYGIPLYETSSIDTIYQCFNSLETVVNGVRLLYVDRDGFNQTVHLQPTEGLTDNIRRFSSQPKLYSDPSWLPGTYRRRTTVNCEVTDMIGRSNPPFDFFVTAVGDTVEVSPFPVKDGKGNLPTGVSILSNYSLVDYDKRGVFPADKTRAFFETSAYTISWELESQQAAHCPLALWKSFSRSIRTNQTTTFHFVANDVTATFTTPLTPDPDFTTSYPCIVESVKAAIEEKFKEIKSSHTKVGDVQYFTTTGGLHLAWQPVVQNQLIQALEDLREAENVMVSRRRRQAPEEVPDHEGSGEEEVVAAGEDDNVLPDNIIVPQLQFAYDSLRTDINGILKDLARSWCREQNRATHMWFELSKINPTSVMSAIYGRPVSAKSLGDVVSVSECVVVDQSSVSIHKSLRTQDATTCYSRPPVTFKFVNGTTVFVGQLGMRNEIMLTTNVVETCQEGSLIYIQAGRMLHVYRDYIHTDTVPMSNISTLDTFIALNTSFIENINFQVVDLYSRRERAASNVFDMETMLREYNYYTQRIRGIRRDLDNSLENNRDRVVESFGAIMEDLGTIGKTVVNAASSVVTFLGSLVTGFINFVKHPLGGFLIICLIVAVVIILFMINRKTNTMFGAPIKMYYPDVDKAAEAGTTEKLSDAELNRILLSMHLRQQSVKGGAQMAESEANKGEAQAGSQANTGGASQGGWLNRMRKLRFRKPVDRSGVKYSSLRNEEDAL